MKQVVLDTNVLCLADSSDFDAIGVLVDIERHASLALDVESEILREYRSNLGNGHGLSAKWLVKIFAQAGKTWVYSHKLSAKTQTKLRQLQFDPNDWKFVGVATKTAPDSRLIVNTVDSDWAVEVLEYLERELDVRVVDCRSASRLIASEG